MTLHTGTFHPGAKNDIDALNTHTHKSLVDAINELQHVGGALNETVVAVALGLTGPVAIPALPLGSIIIGFQVGVKSVYPASTVINVGDHSGSSGALAATSISSGSGVTMTAAGDYNVSKSYTPVGDLSIQATGGDGSIGASLVFVRYVSGVNAS